MKYYGLNGKILAYFKEGAIEIESPIREDGTVLPKHKNLHLCKVDENENYYEYYKLEMVDGMYVPDTVKIEAEADLKTKAISKKDRTTACDSLVITIENGKQFNGDKKAIADLKNAIDTAKEYAEMYPQAQPMTETDWKLYDDTIVP